MKSPLVYIIILNYNGAGLTLECVESFKRINYKNYKIVVIDNNSSDDSYKILLEKLNNYENCVFIKLEDNLGYAGGNNIGIDMAIKAKAEYILIANNDIIVAENFLNLLVNSLNEEKNLAAVTPKVFYYNTNIINSFGSYKNAFGKIKNIGIGMLDSERFESDLYVKFLMGCCILFRANILSEIGGFDERYFMYLEESDLFERINKEYKLKVISKSKVWHKEFGSSKSSNGKINYFSTYYLRRNSLLYIDKHYGIKGIISKIMYFSIDSLKILLNIKDKKLRNVIKLAWSDYFRSHFFRSEIIQQMLKS